MCMFGVQDNTGNEYDGAETLFCSKSHLHLSRRTEAHPVDYMARLSSIWLWCAFALFMFVIPGPLLGLELLQRFQMSPLQVHPIQLGWCVQCIWISSCPVISVCEREETKEIQVVLHTCLTLKYARLFKSGLTWPCQEQGSWAETWENTCSKLLRHMRIIEQNTTLKFANA